MGSATPLGVLPERPTRQRDGARLACPDHPHGSLCQGWTASGQIRTWCLVDGCPSVARWIAPETASPEGGEDRG